MAVAAALCAERTGVHDKLSFAFSRQYVKTGIRQASRLARNYSLRKPFPLANTPRAKQPKRLFAECTRSSFVVASVKKDGPSGEGIEQMLAAIPLRIKESTSIVISEPRDRAAPSEQG